MGLLDKKIRKQAIKGTASRILGSLPNGMSQADATKFAEGVVDEAFELQKEKGTDILPVKAAHLVLTQSVPFLPENYLQYLLAEGVTTEDIGSWWNLPDIYRWLDVVFQEFRLGSYYQTYLRELGEPVKAWWAVYSHNECFSYGPPVEHELLKGDDRPLPFELHDRNTAYLNKRILAEGGGPLPPEEGEYKTRNSRFRAMIRCGQA